jgi:2-succinyl-6-hydroxy-2,4-cyclohexadiene-1-carboxylate synthase
VSADLPGTADLLADTCGRATYVGYSLGGRVCLHLAVARPDLVERLAVLGATPGLRDADERAARVAGDEALAERIIAIGVDAFLDEWTALPLFGALRPTADDLAARRANSAAGLGDSLRRCGTGTQQPLWDRLGPLSMPVLAMAGSRDTKFLTLAREIAASVQHGRFRSIPDADHAAHLQQPAAVLAELSELLTAGPDDDWR